MLPKRAIFFTDEDRGKAFLSFLRSTIPSSALFFVISGLFFRSEYEPLQFLQKNVKSLVVPFLFFYTFSYVLFYLGTYFVLGFNNLTEAKGIMDCFTQKQYFNGPLWFIICLFWIKLINFLIQKLFKKEAFQVLIVLAVGALGFYLGKNECDLPLALDTALTFTPVLYGGVLMSKYSVLHRYSKSEHIIFSIILYLSCYPVTTSISASINRYEWGVYFNFLAFSALLSLSILFLCKELLNKSIILSFIGRNSMWIMCTHHLVYRPIKLFTDSALKEPFSVVCTFTLTLIICCVTAPLVNKYVPVIIGRDK